MPINAYRQLAAILAVTPVTGRVGTTAVLTNRSDPWINDGLLSHGQAWVHRPVHGWAAVECDA